MGQLYEVCAIHEISSLAGGAEYFYYTTDFISKLYRNLVSP